MSTVAIETVCGEGNSSQAAKTEKNPWRKSYRYYFALRASLRLWILDLKAEKAVNGSKRFGILSPNAPLGAASCIFGFVGCVSLAS
jgi:hypothetical protein